MRAIHMRDSYFKAQPLHYESRQAHLELTDDPKLVTCKRCPAMIKRQNKQRS